MTTKDSEIYEHLGDLSPFLDRIGRIHIIESESKKSKPMRLAAKLIAVVGENLLFERKNGIRLLINPATVRQIIELPPQDSE